MKQPTYMLDTDMFSYLVSGRYPRVRELVAEREKSIVISSVTLAESLFGTRKRPDGCLGGVHREEAAQDNHIIRVHFPCPFQ